MRHYDETEMTKEEIKECDERLKRVANYARKIYGPGDDEEIIDTLFDEIEEGMR